MTPERKKRMDAVLDYRQPDLVVVLENVQDPHNIGAVMRSADSVGVQDIYLINTKLSAADFGRRRSTGSAEKWMTIHEFPDTASAVAALKTQGFKIWCTHLGADAQSLYDIDFCEKVALAFGNEKEGLSSEILEQSDGNFIIPQVGMIKSLNISVACAVSLYEAYRQRANKQMYAAKNKLNESQRQAVFAKWAEVYEK